MSIRKRFSHLVALSAFASMSLLCYGDAVAAPNTARPGLQPSPTIPDSKVALQNGLNNYNACIAKALSAASSAGTTSTTDAVTSQCAEQQATLKKLLPPKAFDQGATESRQYVSQALSAQSAIPKATEQPEKIPSSQAVLQSALSSFKTCVKSALTSSQDQTTALTTIKSQCASQQAQLKQMLPPDSYDKDIADTQHYVSTLTSM